MSEQQTSQQVGGLGETSRSNNQKILIMTLISVSSSTRTEIRKFLKLAIPLASAQVAQSLTG